MFLATHAAVMLTAFQLSQLLGVDVMLTLMDQLCDQQDLFVVHEGFFLFCGRPTAALLI